MPDIADLASPEVLGRARKIKLFLMDVDGTLTDGVTNEEVAYMGDDLSDIPLAQRTGLAISVADGADELKAVCHYITQRLAGRGAAREVIELILKAQGRSTSLLEARQYRQVRRHADPDSGRPWQPSTGRSSWSVFRLTALLSARTMEVSVDREGRCRRVSQQ
jgi:hypothetical protein